MGLAAIFVCSVVVGLVVHLGSAAGRRVVAALLGEALSDGVRGDIAVAGVRRLDLDGIEITTSSARDARGLEVLRVEGVRIEIDAGATARSWLGGAGPIVVAVPRISVQRAAIRLDRGPGPGAQPAIVEALTPRRALPSLGGRAVALSIGRVEIAHVGLAGELGPGRAIQAEAREVAGSLEIAPAALRLSVERACFTERARRAGRVDACLSGRVAAVAGSPLEGSARIAGHVGEVALAAAARLRGDQLTAEIRAPRVEPAAVAALAPGAPLRRPIAVAARARGPLDALEVEAHVTALPRDAVALASTDERGGSISMRARLGGLPPRWISAEVEARGIALRDLHEGAPDARVSAEGRAAVSLGEGPPRGVAMMRIAPVALAGFQVPAVDAWARFHGAEVQGEAAVREPDAEMVIAFDAARDAARLDVRALVRDLRVKGVSLGDLQARAAVSAAPRSRALKIDLGEVRLQGRDIELTLAGAPARPLEVTVGRALRVGGDVRIRSGALPILGRRVTIEPGLIRLDEEAPARPHLELAASYPTSRGSRIRVRYRGALDLAALGSTW